MAVIREYLHRCVPRAAVYAALACLAVGLAAVVANAWDICFSGTGDTCCVGEWLINYGGGFVRRGLGGTVIFWSAELTGLRPRLILFAILVTCYTLTFGALGIALLRSREITALDLLLVLSPFAALFPAIHHVAGQRKEVLLFAIMGLAYVTDLGALRSTARYLFWALVLATLVAVHDGVFLFVPLFILYLTVLTPPSYPVGLRGVLLGLPAFAVFLLGYARSSHVDLAAICATMEKYEKGMWCIRTAPGEFPYAVSWLKATALDGVRSVARRYDLLTGSLTLLAGATGLLPVGVALARDSARLRQAIDRMSAPRLYLAGCIAALLTLFVVANDWNRWFYVITSMLTMIHFAAQDRSEVVATEGEPSTC
jgi:hypothetical protein